MEARVAEPVSVTALFQRLGEDFVAGRLIDMASTWLFPCPVQLGDQITTIRSAAELIAHFEGWRDAMGQPAAVRLVPRIMGIELPRDGRFRVWLRWVHHRSDGSRDERSAAVYHLVRQPTGALCIEGLESVAVLPETVADHPARPVSGAAPPGRAAAEERARIRVALFQLLEELGAILTEGRYADLARIHVLPCPYEAEGSYEVMHTPEELAAVVGRWCEAQAARGVVRFEARLVAQELPRGPRLRAWFRWLHHMADGSVEHRGTDLMFLVRRPDGRLAIEMIDFLSLPSPDADEAPA